MYICKDCKYFTDKKYNFIKHQNSIKHQNMIETNAKECTQCSPLLPQKTLVYFKQNVVHSEIPLVYSEQNLVRTLQFLVHPGKVIPSPPNKFVCDKCSKIYKTEKCYINHQNVCKGISSLTCPKCMKTFSSAQSKSKHKKKNNCKPKSIFDCLTITNNIENIIYINNYTEERFDFITKDDMLQIIKSCDNNILPKYIALKHYNPKFPENKNVLFHKNVYYIKMNDILNVINSDALANRLYNDNAREIANFCFENDQLIKDFFLDEDLYEKCKEKTNFVCMRMDGSDNEIKRRIKDVIKTHNRLRHI